MTGRTTNRWLRIWMDGLDLSGDASGIGELEWSYEDTPEGALSWAIKGCLPGQPTIKAGAINGYLNSTAGAIHGLAAGEGVERTLMVALGIRADPALGDPLWIGKFQQGAYKSGEGKGLVPVTVPLSLQAPGSMVYDIPWGVLLFPKSTQTGAYTGSGVDQAASTAYGGYLAYQVFSLDAGTVTLSVQDSADGSTYAAVSGLTTSAIAAASAPCGGIINLAKTVTVRRYVRPQIALAGGATTAVVALGFVRGRSF